MKKLKSSITLRGDYLYCPLALSVDSYGNCLINCPHCYLRKLNYVWDDELKPADLTILKKKLVNGLNNKNPKTPLAWALYNKKTIRFGNKTDPFQLVEREFRISDKILSIFIDLNWSFVIQTRFLHIMMDYESKLLKAHQKGLLTIMPVMSPGLEKDWEVFEKKLTTPINQRILYAKYLLKKEVNLGFNGEPFIPGYHTIKDFETTLKLLKSNNIKSYNTYNFHFNDFVAKNLHKIGIDIEKIWYYNRDKEWKKILKQLLELSIKYGIILGNPDFVNTGKDWVEKANTCCGVNVQNPCTFNTHYFKKYAQKGYSCEKIINKTFDGIGSIEEGKSIIEGKDKKRFNLKDAGL